MKSASSHSAKRRVASKKSTSPVSQTNWARLRAMKDEDIIFTREHPEADIRHIVRGVVRRGLKPIAAKTSISLRMDAEVLDWFKRQGPGYQTRMNAVLRAFKEASA